ncbi:MAG: diacylglycerol kinase family protein [Acidobacteriota bacterium]
MSAPRTAVLVTGAAGGGRASALWERIEWGVGAHRLEVLRPETAAEARRQLSGRLAGLDRLVVVGGDGTANLAIDAVLRAGRGAETAVGLVPAGTGSDFARALGLPRRAEAALSHALVAAPRPLDAISVTVDGASPRYCLNIASIGLSGAVDLEVNARRERGSYLLTTLGAVWRYRPRACHVEVDGELLTDAPFFVVACANGRYFGQGMKVAPDAVVDDGLLDVVRVDPVPRWQLPLRMAQFFTGRHVHLPQVEVRRGRQVRVEPPEDFFPFDLDGETLDAGPATIEVLPGALRFVR